MLSGSVQGRTGRETLYRRVLPNSTYPVAGLGGGDVAEALGCPVPSHIHRRRCPSSTRPRFLVERLLVPLQVMRKGISLANSRVSAICHVMMPDERPFLLVASFFPGSVQMKDKWKERWKEARKAGALDAEHMTGILFALDTLVIFHSPSILTAFMFASFRTSALCDIQLSPTLAFHARCTPMIGAQHSHFPVDLGS